jgi:hypothetical protein
MRSVSYCSGFAARINADLNGGSKVTAISRSESGIMAQTPQTGHIPSNVLFGMPCCSGIGQRSIGENLVRLLPGDI